MQSVLAKATKDQVVVDPYPHIVIENALDGELYARLSDSYPSREIFVGSEQQLANTKYSLSGPECLAHDGVSEVWKEFIRYHTSAAFYAEVVALFDEHLHDYYENVEQALGKSFAEMTVGLREPKFSVPNMSFPHDVVMDCQPRLDYTFTQRAFRGPHVDSGTQIYGGLLYMREEGDESSGGALAIWRPKDEETFFPAPRTYRFDSRMGVVDRDKLDLVYEIPYRSNCMVLFLNSWRSLHCAQTRTPTLFPRRAVNIIGEICRYNQREMFPSVPPPHLVKQKPTLLHRLKHKVKQTVTG